VIVDGTHFGAMSLADGSYRLTGIPPGPWRIRGMMMGFATREMPVTVVADSVTTLDLVLDVVGVTHKVPPRPPGTRVCEVHGIEMRAVTVPLSYGLRVDGVDEAAARGFPNADPSGPDDPVGRLSAEPATTWVYRCEMCVRARNEWLNDGPWLEFGSVPAGWAVYSIDGAVTFRAPPGLTPHADDNGCVATREWTGDGIRVRARYGLWPHVQMFRSGDMHGDVIVGDTYAHVVLQRGVDGSDTLGAGFQAPPAGNRILFLDFDIANDDMLHVACAVVNSVRFSERQ
jgi:hypothetical protein